MAFRYKGGISFEIYFEYCVVLIDLLLFVCVQCTKVDFSMCEHFCFYFSHHFISFTWVCTLCCVQPMTRFIQMIQYIIVHKCWKSGAWGTLLLCKSILMKHFPFIHLFGWVSFIGFDAGTHTHILWHFNDAIKPVFSCFLSRALFISVTQRAFYSQSAFVYEHRFKCAKCSW